MQKNFKLVEIVAWIWAPCNSVIFGSSTRLNHSN